MSMNRAVVFSVLVFFSTKCESFLWSSDDDHLQRCDFNTFLQQLRGNFREFSGPLPWFKVELRWSIIVRKYLSECFPADERTNDATLIAHPSEHDFPDQYEITTPLGWFRINQAIQKFYIPEKNQDFWMPDYITLQKEALADEQQRASYINHKRLYFRNLAFLGDACEMENAPFIFSGQRIFSLMHERNMPFEIPCLTCFKKVSASNVVNTFYLLPRRDVFASVRLRDRIEAFLAYEFDVEKVEKDEEMDIPTTTLHATTTTARPVGNDTLLETNSTQIPPGPTITTSKIPPIKKASTTQRRYHRIPFAAFLHTFATKKLTDPNNEEKRTAFRGPFLADRWWDRMVVDGNGFEMALPVPDGRLRVNPDPGRLRQYYTHFNSMTVVCAQEVDGSLVETDVVINVDTLIEDPVEERPECLFNLRYPEQRKQECTVKYRTFQERRQDDYGKLDYRYRIRDYQAIPAHFQAILKPEYNLKIDIGYEPWSCCSACCCTQELCGREYALDVEQCRKLESYRTRVAYMSFFKIDPLKKVTLSLNVSYENSYMQEVIMTFDKYLSSDPYFTTGIPIHSTLMLTDAYWRKLRRFLVGKMLSNNINYAIEQMKGRLGLFIESESCEDLKQKHDCKLLDKCREGAQGMKIISGDKHTMKVTEEILNTFEGCKDEIAIDRISINDLEVSGTVIRGRNYLININETFFGTVLRVAWRSGLYEVPSYNERLPCSSQRIAVAPDKKGLLIIGARKEDTTWPYIAMATMAEDGSSAYFKILLKFVRPDSGDSTMTKWFIFILGLDISLEGCAPSVIFTILSSLLTIVHIIQPKGIRSIMVKRIPRKESAV